MADNDVSDISVPVLNLKHIQCTERQEKLRRFFYSEYGSDPEYFVNVPGRVNIIGEHVDYCGYPVLPMAVEQTILLAVSKTDDGILQLRNADKRHANFKEHLDSFNIEIPTFKNPAWSSYFLCGVKGIFEYINLKHPKYGMMVAVEGNIPPASGLSSSSALVCSAVLATSFSLNLSLCSNTLATIAANCERYIGTQGGGMDQAIAFLAKSGCAQLIEFHPVLKSINVKLPKTVCFVVANSLTEINKAATSDFNQRVVECKIACRLMAKKSNFNNWKDITQFICLQNRLCYNLEEMEKFAKKALDSDSYSRDDLLTEFSVTNDTFEKEFLTENTKQMERFKLRQRTLHVLQESLRVQKFRNACENGDNIETLSELMEQSHESLRYLYECSHPNLDKLIKISKDFGVGARLTGAGWGGCIVACCASKEICDSYIQELKDKYYKNLPQSEGYNMDNVIFSTFPQNGARIFLLDK